MNFKEWTEEIKSRIHKHYLIHKEMKWSLLEFAHDFLTDYYGLQLILNPTKKVLYYANKFHEPKEGFNILNVSVENCHTYPYFIKGYKFMLVDVYSFSNKTLNLSFKGLLTKPYKMKKKLNDIVNFLFKKPKIFYMYEQWNTEYMMLSALPFDAVYQYVYERIYNKSYEELNHLKDKDIYLNYIMINLLLTKLGFKYVYGNYYGLKQIFIPYTHSPSNISNNAFVIRDGYKLIIKNATKKDFAYPPNNLEKYIHSQFNLKKDPDKCKFDLEKYVNLLAEMIK